MQLQLYMPVTASLTDRSGNKRELETEDMSLRLPQMQAALESMEAFPRLQKPNLFLKDFTGSHDTQKKIHAMQTVLVIEENGIYGEMVFECGQALTPSEQEELSMHIDFLFENDQSVALTGMVELPEGKLEMKLWNPYESQFLIDWEDKAEVKKYRITNVCHPQYPKVRRIQALKDIPPNVRRGDLGGFVEKEWNLSQNGTSWIFDNAVCMEQARVQGDAVLLQSAMAREGTLLGGTAKISGKSIVKGQSYIRDAAIKDSTIISGEAILEPYKDTGLCPVVGGNSYVCGVVSGWFVIKNSAVFPDEKLRNPTKDLMMLENGLKKIRSKNELGNQVLCSQKPPILKNIQPER